MERLQDILADNLTALMEEREDLATQGKISARTKRYTQTGTPLAQSSIGRIVNKQVHTSLDIVELLAQVFQTSPLDLLTKRRKVQREALTHHEWEIIDLWRQLKDDDKAKLMAYLSIAVTTGDKHLPAPVREIGSTNAQGSTSERIGTLQEVPKSLLKTEEVKDAKKTQGTGKRDSVAKKSNRKR